MGMEPHAVEALGPQNGEGRADAARRAVRRALMWAALAMLLSVSLVACRVTVRESNSSAGVAIPEGGTSVPIRVQQDDRGSTLATIELTIAGKGPYPFAVDTGASTTLIDQTLADELALPQDGRGGRVSGVGGTVDTTPVVIRDWSAGDLKLPEATVAAADLPAFGGSDRLRGLLGSDVLSRFQAVTIDYANQKLIILHAATKVYQVN